MIGCQGHDLLESESSLGDDNNYQHLGRVSHFLIWNWVLHFLFLDYPHHDHDESVILDVDRFDDSHRRPDYHQFKDQNNAYNDEDLYDAFNYGDYSISVRPSHRPFNNNGPAIIDRNPPRHKPR